MLWKVETCMNSGDVLLQELITYPCGQDKEAIKKHAELSGFPATHIEEIKTEINPITGS